MRASLNVVVGELPNLQVNVKSKAMTANDRCGYQGFATLNDTLMLLSGPKCGTMR